MWRTGTATLVIGLDEETFVIATTTIFTRKSIVKVIGVKVLSTAHQVLLRVFPVPSGILIPPMPYGLNN